MFMEKGFLLHVRCEASYFTSLTRACRQTHATARPELGPLKKVGRPRQPRRAGRRRGRPSSFDGGSVQRSALPITLTEESSIAAAAMTADKTMPNAA